MASAKHKLPAIYWSRFFPQTGGLMSYGPSSVDLHHQSASYVDRILKGARPAELPIQTAIKYETVVNLKTAKALGLEIPAHFAAGVDDLVE